MNRLWILFVAFLLTATSLAAVVSARHGDLFGRHRSFDLEDLFDGRDRGDLFGSRHRQRDFEDLFDERRREDLFGRRHRSIEDVFDPRDREDLFGTRRQRDFEDFFDERHRGDLFGSRSSRRIDFDDLFRR